ncbi:hypothetical protein E2C01_056474 [Portunus trituberculatus]|uniref:Uncharacterized protein n=1 Tax=Portunus trituberculatus TaxID=210409 RepID=A0A5B7GQQ5_PORTR|nr:hypothetical protein [Portunus trituberculatus]
MPTSCHGRSRTQMAACPSAPACEHSYRSEAWRYSVLHAAPMRDRMMRNATRWCGAASNVYTQRNLRDPPRPNKNTSLGEAKSPSGRSVKVRSHGPPPGVGVPHCRLSTNS